MNGNTDLRNNLALRPVFEPGTIGTSAIYGNWHSLRNDDGVWQNAMFVISAPASLTGNVVAGVFAAEDASGTNAEAVLASTKNGTLLATTADGKVAAIEVRAADIPVTKPYVTLQLTAAQNEEFSVVGVFGNVQYAPADNGTTYVAFVK